MSDKRGILKGALTFFLRPLLLCIFLAVFSLNSASAEFLRQIAFQGRIIKSGLPGNFNFTFRIYGAETGGSPLWSERQELSVDETGVFSCYLGSVTALSAELDFNSNYYLSIEINGDGEMSPRFKIVPSPYAINTERFSGLQTGQFLRSDVADSMLAPLTLSDYFSQVYSGVSADAFSVSYSPSSGTRSALAVFYGSAGGSGTAAKITQSGSGNILELLKGSAVVFTVDNSGRVGIGTSSPAHTLEVAGTGAFSGDLQVGSGTPVHPSSGADAYVNGNLEVGGNIYGAISSSGPGVFESGITVTGESNLHGDILNSTGDLNFNDNAVFTGTLTQSGGNAVFDTDSLVVDSTVHRVGIGIADPQAKLSVKGESSGSDNNAFSVLNLADASLMSVRDDGRVGIGISGSGVSAALHIAPPANEEAFMVSSYSQAGSNAQSMFDLSGSWETTGNPSVIKMNITDIGSGVNSSLLDLRVSNISRFYVKKDGSLGIGTASPDGRLDVSNYTDSTLASEIYISDETDIVGSDPVLKLRTGAVPAVRATLGIDHSDSNKFKIEYRDGLGGATPALTIDSSSRLGIGINNPVYRLDISDAVTTRGINVANNTASSYGIYAAGTLYGVYGSDGTASGYLGYNHQYGLYTADNAYVGGALTVNGSLGVNSALNVKGDLNPSDDNAYDLGSKVYRWKALNTASGGVNIYNAYIDDSNYELANIGYISDVVTLQSSGTGSGTVRPIQITTGSNIGFYMDSSGNTGLGNISPQSRLHVTAAENDEAVKADGSVSGTDSNSLVSLAAAWTTFGNPTAVKLEVTDSSSGDSSKLFDLLVNSASKFSVDKSGNIYLAGKLGIQNASPAGALGIGSISNDEAIVAAYSLSGSNAQSLLDLTGTWNTSGAPTAVKLNITDSASASSSALLDMQVAGASKFIVRKDGSVGLGIAAPTARLNINGVTDDEAISVENYALSGTSTNPAVNVSGQWNTTAAPTLINIDLSELQGTPNTASTLMGFWVNEQSRFLVQENGKVAIGTNQSKTGWPFSLQNGFDVRTAVRSGGGVAKGINFQQTLTATSATDALTAVDINPTFAGTAGAYKYGLLVRSGNVGIKAVTPAQSLEVNGSIKIGSEDVSVPYQEGTIRWNSGTLHFEGYDGTNWNLLDVQSPSDGGWTDDGAVIRLTTVTDNVGVGTVSPVGKLEVSNEGEPTPTQPVLYISNETDNDVFDPVVKFRSGGTPAVRFTAGVDHSDSNKYKIEAADGLGGASPAFTINGSSQVGIGIASPLAPLHVASTLSSDSAVEYGMLVSPTVAQSGTAGYSGLLVNLTESTAGSGTKRLLDVQLGGSSKFSVNSSGVTVTNALSVNGDTALGDDGADTLTLNSTAVAVPNSLNIDSNTLYIDSTSHRVGVGTVTPGDKIEVNGNLLLSNGQKIWSRIDDTAGKNAGITPFDASGDMYITNRYGLSSSHGRIYLQTSDTNDVPQTRVSVSKDGKVGIGVDAPSELLEVSSASQPIIALTALTSSSSIDPVIKLRSGATPSVKFTLGVDSSDLSKFKIESGDALGGAAPSFTMDSTGKIGLGTASPASSLHVVGSEGRLIMQTASNTASVGSYLTLRRSQGSAAVPVADNAADNLGVLTVQGYTDDWQSAAGINVEAETGWGASGADAPGRMIFLTTPDDSGTPEERMRIDSVGRVGVGTNSISKYATDQLEQALDFAGTLQLRRVADASGTSTTRNSNILQLQGAYWTGAASANRNWKIKNIVSSTTPNYRIAFIDHDDNERMSLSDSGKLGIGVDTPVEALDVNGRQRLQRTTAPSVTTDKLYNVSGNLYWDNRNLIGGLMPSGSDGQTLYYGSSVWNASSNLYHNGTSVGIGTTGPVTSLTVNKASQTSNGATVNGALTVSDLVNTDAVFDIGLINSSGTGWIQSRNKASATYYNIVINPNGGNVGIGTTSPDYALQVNGTIAPETDQQDLGVTGTLRWDLFGYNVNVAGTLDASANAFKPKIYSQTVEPDIDNDTCAFWKDTDDSNKYYLILDIGGTQKKVQLL